MNSDTSSGENSGNSNSSDKSKPSKKSRSTRTQQWTTKSSADHDEGVSDSRQTLYQDLMDRESAAKAVAMVVHAASKRGYVYLCAEFASLISQNKRMELENKRLKFIINQLQMRTSKKGVDGSQCCSSSSNSESGSGGSHGSKGKKPEQQTSINGFEELEFCQGLRSFSVGRGSHSAPGSSSSKTNSEELRKAQEQILILSNQVELLASENQVLKDQSQKREPNNDLPVLKTTAHAIKIPKNHTSLKQLNLNLKHSNPRTPPSTDKSNKMSTDHSSKKISIDNTPVKSIGTSLTPLHLYKGNQQMDIARHKSTPLPKLGDYVTVGGEIKGYVNYVGPIKGESSHFVGIQLPSPVGNNDGSMDGVKYFTCPQNYGAFVPVHEIKHIIPKPPTPYQF